MTPGLRSVVALLLLAARASGAEDRLKFVRWHDLELRVRAVLRLLVSAPATKLCRVTKTIALHVLVRNFDYELGSQRLPRKILALTPATLSARDTVDLIARPLFPRMFVERVFAVRL